jgi:S-adenosylmethionine:tRNA-ribosyltransferase-isomerase (queuine synthetase)
MIMEGYIVEKQSNKMLVVNPNPKEHTDAVWFSNIPNSIEIGDKVIVSFDIMLESYPGVIGSKRS